LTKYYRFVSDGCKFVPSVRSNR